ncbi:MAG TPA: CAP domain-containing protein [Ktedonobacteraceae bacterium]|nr:CAP domain-containing protein [Ktedonobacteraceae bacterium]
MKRFFRRLTWVLMIAGAIVSLAALSTPGLAHADTACAPQPTLPADVSDPNAAFDTAAHVITTFNFARQQEGCTVSLSIDPTAYAAATPQMQTLMLVNAERKDRGLGTLQLDSTLISQIDFNHSTEMAQYNYFDHPSPINQPGGNSDPSARITVNPAVNGHNTNCCAENIYAGQSNATGGTPADAIYNFMYVDSSSNWGHRQNILGYNSGIDNNPGHYTWLGVGIAQGGFYGDYYTLDFLEDSTTTPYTPPATADTQAPTMSPPTIVDASTVQVTNVQDDADGSTTGAAGVTGVVFYVGSAVDPNGNFLTVVANQTAPGTWTATLSATDPTTLHAVAVDGSGNYTDCVGGAASCSGNLHKQAGSSHKHTTGLHNLTGNLRKQK